MVLITFSGLTRKFDKKNQQQLGWLTKFKYGINYI